MRIPARSPSARIARIPLRLLILLLSLTPASLPAEDWWLGVGCEGQGTFGTASFTACKSSDCNGGTFNSNGTCSRTATRFTKISFETSAGGTLWSSTRYALHTGDVLIAPAVLTTEEKPVFTAQSECPLANHALNWIFVQWDSGTRTMSNTYLLGTASYDTTTGLAVTGQYDIDGSLYVGGSHPMPGTCTNGVYATTNPLYADLTGTVYFTANGGGVFKTTPGHSTIFFPEFTVTPLTELASKTAQGMAFDSRLASNTRPARVTTNASGDQFTVEPYLDPEAGTIDTAFTDVISITATNSPRPGMLIGTIARNGGAAAKIACIVNRNFDTRVICSGESPAAVAYPYTVTFVVEGDGAGGTGCPTNFVRVPRNGAVDVTSDFCIAKYEMKIQGDDNGNQAYSSAFVAESRASGTPWGNLDRASAVAECQALGAGFDLITNAQWQAVARNIEDAYSAGAYLNWSYGRQDNTPSANRLNGGHTDNSPFMTRLAASTDNDPCSGTSNGSCADNTHAHFSQKRTHQLSNGEIVWDLGGNNFEWVKDDSSGPEGTDNVTSLEDWIAGGKKRWGPRGDYTGAGPYPKTSTPFGGFGFTILASSLGTVRRGSYYADSQIGGVFSVTLGAQPTLTVPDTGFRCVYSPPP